MSIIEWDTAYSAMTGEHVSGIYVPTVEHDPDYDCLVDGQIDTEWHFVTGKTQQYGYSGAIMHPSETASDDLIREWVRDAGGDVFAIVPVEAHDDDDPVFPDEPDYCQEYGCAHEPAGWAVIYRSAE